LLHRFVKILFSQRLSLDQLRIVFSTTFQCWDTLTFLQVGDIQTYLGIGYHYSRNRKLLLSSFVLADTQGAPCYELITRFISMLFLRYLHSPRIAVEQLYFHTRVHNTFAGKFK
jgi:hypothetical protein